VKNELCERLGIEFPIFAFSHCRDVVAAVSRAGGLGVLGAVAFSPEQLELELQWIDEHVEGKPYGLDTVMPAKYIGREQGQLSKEELEKMITPKHREWLENLLEKYDVPPLPPEVEKTEALLGWSTAAGRAHVDSARRPRRSSRTRTSTASSSRPCAAT
jgi:NAD(P)H-dependent flavin oxidoreductase YrpB (nitropropane dioxygenase family)